MAMLASTDRSIDLRLARLHLRVGLLALARAELESLAGSDSLDDEGLVDLAEARWRTGDLAGAGEAALAGLDHGAERPLALIVAAEAASAGGQTGDALDLADRALALTQGAIDGLFAGMPRGAFWPAEGAELGTQVEHVHRGPRAAAWPGVDRPPDDPLAEMARAREELAAGRVEVAALRLALVLRTSPRRAPQIIELIGHRVDPPLVLILGDAHRIVGNDDQADRAWAAARASLDHHSHPPLPPPD